RRGLRRLVAAGDGDCRGPVRRPAHAGSLRLGRLLPDFRQDGRSRARRGDQAKPCRGAEQFKTVALGGLYGLSAEGLARKLNAVRCRGRELLRLDQDTFRPFWRWSDRVEMEAMLTGRLPSISCKRRKLTTSRRHRKRHSQRRKAIVSGRQPYW